jgi:hypothetical protein
MADQPQLDDLRRCTAAGHDPPVPTDPDLPADRALIVGLSTAVGWRRPARSSSAPPD